MNIVLFNVKYSENLGDGLLSECLERELVSCDDRLRIACADLAGRTVYSRAATRRRALLKGLSFLPPWARRPLVDSALRLLVHRRLGPRWREALADADFVLVGGGNLLADADLNFPRKIAGALDLAHERRLPVGVYGVGVSPGWSSKGTRLFREVLARPSLVYASVRDPRSAVLWRDQLGAAARAPEVVFDPGLLCHRHFHAMPTEPVVAVCITSPLALDYHRTSGPGFGGMDRWLAGLVQGLLDRSLLRISLFTNGSTEDRVYLSQVAPGLIALDPARVTVRAPFADPAELARYVSAASLLFAHRMHACIAAYAYRVPHVGLAWDEKLGSFFRAVDRSRFLLDTRQDGPEVAVKLGIEAMSGGIEASVHGQVVDDARRHVAGLAAAMRACLPGSRH